MSSDRKESSSQVAASGSEDQNTNEEENFKKTSNLESSNDEAPEESLNEEPEDSTTILPKDDVKESHKNALKSTVDDVNLSEKNNASSFRSRTFDLNTKESNVTTIDDTEESFTGEYTDEYYDDMEEANKDANSSEALQQASRKTSKKNETKEMLSLIEGIMGNNSSGTAQNNIKLIIDGTELVGKVDVKKGANPDPGKVVKKFFFGSHDRCRPSKSKL